MTQIEKTIGFIGCGNMARAMIGGMVEAGLVKPEQVLASNPSAPAREEAARRWGIRTTADNREVAKKAQMLVLAVKPHFYASVIGEIKDDLSPDAVVILIAAGQTIDGCQQQFGRPVKLVKAMPNTPAMVGEGMTAISYGSLLTDEERREAAAIFESFGRVQEVREDKMDLVAGVSGSSPAYAYLFIEALADGAVLEGMPRSQAYTFAAQAVLGAAKMVLESGQHPGALKDAVCSPGGTTIEAVAVLEREGLRNAVIPAVRACTEKSRRMTQ